MEKKDIVNIIVADDQPDMVKLATQIIESNSDVNYNIIPVSSGKKVIEQINKRAVDVILCDVVMPKQGGFDILRYTSKKNINTPVILMTASDKLKGGMGKEEAIKLGAYDLLDKEKLTDVLPKTLEGAVEHFKEIKKDEKRKIELKGEKYEKFLSFVNTTYRAQLENEGIAKPGAEIKVFEYVVNDKGLRHLYTKLSKILVQVKNPDSDKTIVTTPYFRKQYIIPKSAGFNDISGRRKKRDDRCDYETAQMKFLFGRKARVVKPVFTEKDNIYMENLPAPTNDIEMFYFNDSLKQAKEENAPRLIGMLKNHISRNKKEMVEEYLNRKKKELLEKEGEDFNLPDRDSVLEEIVDNLTEQKRKGMLDEIVDILTEQKQESMGLCDQTIDINSETGSFFMEDIRDVGGKWCGIVRPASSDSEEHNPVGYHQERINNSVIGLALWKYFDDKVRKEEIGRGDLLMAQKINLIKEESNIIGNFEIDTETQRRLEESLKPVLNCYRSSESVAHCHADIENTEHLVRHKIKCEGKNGEPDEFIEVMLQYDLDGVIWDKWVLDNLSYLYDHIGNDFFDSIDKRFEGSVIRRHNARVEFNTNKTLNGQKYNGYLPESKYDVDYSKTIKSLEELPEAYVADVMKQKDLLTIEVLLYYQSLGAWNQLKNTHSYYALLERRTTANFSFTEEKFDFAYKKVYDNRHIVDIQSKRLNAHLDRLIKNENHYYKLKPSEVSALKNLKEILTKGIKVKDEYRAVA